MVLNGVICAPSELKNQNVAVDLDFLIYSGERGPK